jgi:hypothetical protein
MGLLIHQKLRHASKSELVHMSKQKYNSRELKGLGKRFLLCFRRTSVRHLGLQSYACIQSTERCVAWKARVSVLLPNYAAQSPDAALCGTYSLGSVYRVARCDAEARGRLRARHFQYKPCTHVLTHVLDLRLGFCIHMHGSLTNLLHSMMQLRGEWKRQSHSQHVQSQSRAAHVGRRNASTEHTVAINRPA